jgi:hypothetical protein
VILQAVAKKELGAARADESGEQWWKKGSGVTESVEEKQERPATPGETAVL